VRIFWHPRCRLLCRFLGRRHDDASMCCCGRRPRSAKARNRGKWGTDGAGGRYGDLAAGSGLRRLDRPGGRAAGLLLLVRNRETSVRDGLRGGAGRSGTFTRDQRLTERCGRLGCFEAKRLFSLVPAPRPYNRLRRGPATNVIELPRSRLPTRSRLRLGWRYSRSPSGNRTGLMMGGRQS
jgi:hypothetical protein